MTIVVALAAKTGTCANRIKPLLVKKHGRKAASTFARGLAGLRKILALKVCDQVIAILQTLISPNWPPKPLIGLTF